MTAHRIARAAAIFSIAAFLVWCLANTFFVTVPFWSDEWRIIYNLKTRSVAGLWAPLDYMQQAPRAYLSILKWVGAAGDYGYTSLRIPALVVTSVSVVVVWRLMHRLFKPENPLRYLFPLILISSVPFTKYAVQAKHYPADILTGLVALWQGLEMLRISRGETTSRWRYTLLVASFLAAPFFSYTYPMALAPVMGALLVEGIQTRNLACNRRRWQTVLLPIALLAAAAIAAAWWADTRHAVADTHMHIYWRDQLWATMTASQRLRTFYIVFSQIGAGDFFGLVFGWVGVAAFIWTLTRGLGKRKESEGDHHAGVTTFMRPYALLSIAVAWVLFAAGKLPLGEARLNTFLTLPIAWMLVDFLGWLTSAGVRKRWMIGVSAALATLLYVGTAGNLLTTIAAEYTDARWPTKRRIYLTIAEAIDTARALRLPILATPRIAFPEEAHDNLPFPEKMPGDWVLKTHPAYRYRDSIRVYRLPSIERAEEVLRSLPTRDTAAVVCAGDTMFVVNVR